MKVPSVWPDWLDQIWAKSPVGGASEGESLARHTWEVLSRLADLIRLRPALPKQINFPRLWHLLFWVVFLHDWGKIAKAFQEVLRGGPRWPHRHEVLSLAFLHWIESGFTEDEITWVASAIASHHRDASELKDLYPLKIAPEDDPLEKLVQELDEEAVRGLWQWLHKAGEDWINSLGLKAVGVSMPPLLPEDEAIQSVMERSTELIRFWLRRYYRLVRHLTDGQEKALTISALLLRGYLVQADHVASAHVSELKAPEWKISHTLASKGLDWDDLYRHQQDASQTEDSALLIAPTGSGKTEAALLWAEHQAQKAPGVARLFYTLPYQASMNAMFRRLQEYFPEQVGLVHGRSTLALYRMFMEQDYNPEEATRMARWMRNLARLNVHPVRVLSPYQMLKAAYQLKGYEAMLADYADSLFIFDEIHAYEPSRLAMIIETIRYLQENLGARFFVMSATFPSPIRKRLEEVLNVSEPIRASADLFKKFTRHRLFLCEGDLLSEKGLKAIVQAFQEGKSVLVTCNTVTRAQEAYQALTNLLPDAPKGDIILIHGRFNNRDRLEKEKRILEATGLNAARRRPVLVVSTQVVEVSLNIDLDVIFSDPAPLEALMQRFGRINRKGRIGDLAPVYVFTEPSDGQGIYEDGLVQGALKILEKHANTRPIDEASVQDWLDEIYTGEVLEQWDEVYEKTAREFRTVFLEPLRPFDSDPNLEEEFDKLFDGLEVLPACLKEEYEALKEKNPLEASQLLVPISWGRWHQLVKAQRVVSGEKEWPKVVDVPYSEKWGLDFKGI